MMFKINREWNYNLREVEDPAKYLWWSFFGISYQFFAVFSVLVLNTPLNPVLFVRNSQIEFLSLC